MITSDRSRVWVKIRLLQILKTLNSTPTRITGKETIKALKSKEIDINNPQFKRPVGVSEIRLPPFVKVRYLLNPGEGEGGERTTDRIKNRITEKKKKKSSKVKKNPKKLNRL